MLPRTSKHSIVATSAGGLAFNIQVRSHEVVADQPERAGGGDAAPTPLEFLGISLAGCVALYARKHCIERGLDDAGLVVEVKPVWREDPGRVGRFDVVLHVPDTIPVEERDALVAAASNCPVHHTLTHAPEIVMRVEELVAETAGL